MLASCDACVLTEGAVGGGASDTPTPTCVFVRKVPGYCWLLVSVLLLPKRMPVAEVAAGVHAVGACTVRVVGGIATAAEASRRRC